MSFADRGAVLQEVSAERERQIEKWGVQRRPDATGSLTYRIEREKWTQLNDAREHFGRPGQWDSILLEEVFEALAEPAGSSCLRKELVQAAAVIVAWLEDIDTRE